MTIDEYESLPEHLKKIMARPPIPMWDADVIFIENANTGEKREFVRVIRCKNCARRKKNKFCLENMRYTQDDDYCSKSERKEE